jgi:hypothetical protein
MVERRDDDHRASNRDRAELSEFVSYLKSGTPKHGEHSEHIRDKDGLRDTGKCIFFRLQGLYLSFPLPAVSAAASLPE